MATRKTSSNPKKTSVAKNKRPVSSKTNVTTVKTVTKKDARPVAKPAPVSRSARTEQPTSRLKNLTSTNFLATLIAEFIGTFLLVAVALHPQFGSAPFIMFFAAAAIILTFGHISGGWLNPALTIAAWLTKRISGLRAVGYVLMQVLGALLALSILTMYVNQQAPVDQSQAMFGQAAQNIELVQAPEFKKGAEWFMLGAEFLGTFVFALGVAAASRALVGGRITKAFSYGGGLMLGLTVGGLAAAAVGGTVALNPAVAQAVQAMQWNNVWSPVIYIVGSTVGAVLAFALYDMLSRATNSVAAEVTETL